jgi:hypothetical protein
VKAVFLHEVITDMALALELDSLLRGHCKAELPGRIAPSFETRNFVRLVDKVRGLGLLPNKIMIAAPFNSVGFQMSPTKEQCERALATIPGNNVLAFSILAGGYLPLGKATEYTKTLPNLGGLVVGVSSLDQAAETFNFLRDTLHGVQPKGLEDSIQAAAVR